MPDRHVDLFIRFCLRNHGKLLTTTQSIHFGSLTDDEAARMERAVRDGYGADARGQEIQPSDAPPQCEIDVRARALCFLRPGPEHLDPGDLWVPTKDFPDEPQLRDGQAERS
jgi:hypothetical protein